MKPKIVVIVGPTASGKTSLAIEIAKKFNGEVISADSRQVYRGLDIGSAKVTKEEMQGIPHHLLDVCEPNITYTAADFKRDAEQALEDILKRGKLPIICGGTFFYIDTLLGKVTIPEVPPDETLRAKLENKNETELFSILKALDPDRAFSIEKANKRRLIRAIEVAEVLGKVPPIMVAESPYEVLTIGLMVDMEKHGEVIRERLVERFDSGMIAEVEHLLSTGLTHERLEKFGLEYRYISRYLQGKQNYEEILNELTIKSRQFAKRQMTWLKRDKSIKWFDRNDEEIFDTVQVFLGE